MDTRDTVEQAELRNAARRLTAELSATTVADLDDPMRVKRLREAVRDSGWLELRDNTGNGTPLATGAEVAIIADALGATAADVAFIGPILAADLARRAGADNHDGTVVAFASALVEPAIVSGARTSEPLVAVDVSDETSGAFVVVPAGAEFKLARVPVREPRGGSDLTRGTSRIPPDTPVHEVDQHRPLTAEDLDAWSALGLALTSADLVGVMRGVFDISLAYALDRKQYGVAIGSFQAVQHLLAESHCYLEGSRSVALHASWAVDNLGPSEAREAGRIAKAYCSRAARIVCETAIQVYGGIGNTWECLAHVYLRRALLSTSWFGDDDVQLEALERACMGVTDGLS